MPAQTRSSSLLDEVIANTRAADATREARLERFLARRSAWEAIVVWFDLSHGDAAPSRREIVRRLTLDIAAIDRLLNEQLNEILHAPKFQRLEATWRGVRYLVKHASEADNVLVRLLDANWRALSKDLDKAIEFDQSTLFRKVYSDEFGTPGGRPFGVLIGDYYIAHKPRVDQPVDDVRTLRSAAQVAAAAFAPFVTSAHPSLFGLDTFAELGRNIDVTRIFQQTEYVAWNSMRDMEDSRFLAVTLPRVLMRKPWSPIPDRADMFRFEEDVSNPNGESYLWGNAAYAFGGVLIRAFDQCGWFGNIRGVETGQDGGGLVTDFPTPDFDRQAHGGAARPFTDVVVTDEQERILSDHGLISLCACRGLPFAAFYATPTIQRPEKMDTPDATANARLSSMLQYMMCTARVAHYLKMICRDRSGSFASAQEIENEIGEWLFNLSVSSETSDPEAQAKYPLTETGIEVREVPGKPGTYASVIHLRPHFQLDQMSSSIRLTTEILNTR